MSPVMMIGALTIIAVTCVIIDFIYHYVKARKPTLPINHLLGRVFPMPDDPLWESNCLLNSHSFTYNKNIDNSINISYLEGINASIGIKGFPYRISGDTKAEKKSLMRYCKAVRDHCMARDWAKFNAEKQAALDKINYV